MKTKEELNALREEVEALNKKLAELTANELEQITGGIARGRDYWRKRPGQNNDNSPDDDQK